MDNTPKTLTMLSVEPGALIADRYEVCEKIGTGGMGMVFRVSDRVLNDEIVAVKLLHPHLAQDEEVFSRFRNEVLVARSLSHPNIVRTHDMGRASDGMAYISMEFVDGTSLKQVIDGENPAASWNHACLEFNDKLEILFQIANGVEYAHRKGIVHRDLKPANVLISKTGEVKLADFGTARILGLSRGLTQTGQAIGTPDYMSPEQIQGQPVDAACDIYALGMMAYELVTSQKPFEADNPVALAFKHMNEPLPDFSTPESGIPSWFETAVKKASAKKKEERFDSAAEFARVIGENCASLSVDSTMFHQVSSTAIASARETSEIAAKKSKSPVEGGFQLGQVEKEEDGTSWSIGDAGGPAETKGNGIVSGGVQSVREKSTKKNGLYATAVFLSLLLGAVLLPRLTDSGQDLAGRMIETAELAFQKDLNVVRSMLGVPPSSGKKELDEGGLVGETGVAGVIGKTGETVLASKPDSSATSDEIEKQRDQLADQLLLDTLGDDIPSDEEKSKKAVKNDSNEVKANATDGVNSDSTANAAKLESEVESSAPPEVKPEKVVEKKPPPSPRPVSSKFEIAEGRKGEADSSFSVTKLGALRWRALVSGFDGIEKSSVKEFVRKNFYVNVFDPKTAQVLSRVPAVVDWFPKDMGKPLQIGGSFSKLPKEGVGTGSFRFDLVNNGEVLHSNELSFYKASVTYGKPGTTSAGGSKVRVVTGPAYIEPADRQSATTTNIGSLPMESAKSGIVPKPTIGNPVGPAVENSSTLANSVMPQSGLPSSANPAVGSSLPPARKGPGEVANAPVVSSYNKSTLDLSAQDIRDARDAMPNELIDEAPAVPTTSYRGTITWDEVDRRMELRLRFLGGRIEGDATIESVGGLAVEGKVLTRGIELTLRGETIGLRLSGVKRENIIRGRYSIPAQKKRGKWEVRK